MDSPQRPGASATEAVLVGELESERRRRTDLEFELSEARRQIAELTAKATTGGDGDGERLRRRVEQLESELRRKGGVVSGTSGGDAALRATEAERDRLRVRVTELEAQLAAGPPKNDDHEMDLLRLRRRVEQLESELRRLRGGKAPLPESSSADALVADLEEQLRRLKEERDEALRRGWRFDRYRTTEKPEAKPSLAALTLETDLTVGLVHTDARGFAETTLRIAEAEPPGAIVVVDLARTVCAEVVAEHEAGSRDHGYRLWNLYIYLLWQTNDCIPKNQSPAS